MQDIFITKIHIDKVRHLENVDIVLSETLRKHLILTGKNGSGKTSLLNALRDDVQNKQGYMKWVTSSGQHVHQHTINQPNISIQYSQDFTDFRDFMFVYIPARRNDVVIPKSVDLMDMSATTAITRNASRDFLKYILNLDYQLYGAKTDKNIELESNLNKWFDDFVSALRTIYNCPELELRRDTKNLAFKIEIPGREPFALHEMSDGFAAFLEIVMELLMRLEGDGTIVDYKKAAIVMIDEIEAHLHVELQKRILPFLTKMFPNVQFIASTHSPFVITSSADAVVYDLENNERLENPNIYSYEAVLEGYLDVGQYSEDMKNIFARYKELYSKEHTDDEAKEFQQLLSTLNMIPPASKELYLAFRTMEDKRKNDKN